MGILGDLCQSQVPRSLPPNRLYSDRVYFFYLFYSFYCNSKMNQSCTGLLRATLLECDAIQLHYTLQKFLEFR
jgi:hypothetical protein